MGERDASRAGAILSSVGGGGAENFPQPGILHGGDDLVIRARHGGRTAITKKHDAVYMSTDHESDHCGSLARKGGVWFPPENGQPGVVGDLSLPHEPLPPPFFRFHGRQLKPSSPYRP